MLKEQDRMPLFINLFAGISTWIMLAGFATFPATFGTLKPSDWQKLENNTHSGHAKELIRTAAQTSMIAFSSVFLSLGVIGFGVLCWVNWRNYFWVTAACFGPRWQTV